MKIALLSAFYPYRGGIAQFGAMLFRALEIENEVKTYTFKRQYPNILFPGSSQFITDKDDADVIPAERTLDTMNPFSYFKTARRINAFNPDLFISQYWMTFFGPAFGGVQKRLKKGTKRICILHNVIPHEKRFFDVWANKSFLKYNEGFIVMSDVVMNDLLKLKPDARYLRIDHPVYNQFGESIKREDALKELNLPADNKYLLFFGFIRDYKGLDLLIQALANLPEEYHIIVAGESYGSFEKYENLIDLTKTKARVHLFNRYISDSEVRTFFSAADVCVLPYKDATQSGITAIANNFNLPVIATDVGGLKENIRHNETGLIVKQPDSMLIAEAIKHYFNENLKDNFTANIADEKAGNSWENFAKRVLEFSESI